MRFGEFRTKKSSEVTEGQSNFRAHPQYKRKLASKLHASKVHSVTHAHHAIGKMIDECYGHLAEGNLDKVPEIVESKTDSFKQALKNHLFAVHSAAQAQSDGEVLKASPIPFDKKAGSDIVKNIKSCNDAALVARDELRNSTGSV